MLSENLCHEDRGSVLQLLQSLAGTGRFGLNVALLSQAEKESSRELFGKLQSMGRGQGSADHPGSTASCEAEREAHLMDTRLQKEAEEERMMMELMRRYQVS